MTARRVGKDRFLVFDCDGGGCPASLETSFEDFTLAFEDAKAQGFVVRNERGKWHHYCEECADDSY